MKIHLRSCVGECYEKVYKDLLQSSKEQGKLENYGYIATTNKREEEVHHVLQWTVMRNQPSSELDNLLTQNILRTKQKILRTKPISSKTLRIFILVLYLLVENEIENSLPNNFPFQFDGWPSGTMHYVALLASYINEGIHKEIILALGPLLNEESLGAEQYFELKISVSLVYNKHLDNVVAFIGDNCSANRKISNDCGIPLIG